ncbi:hypothetical protein D0C27_05385 [Alcaligenes faecalis]|uniref:heparinase II/III domain-containing protein n=1 Tax=Alcaligenes faecalis TaxID=511 RepID=UPI0010CA3A3F|nr:heparinase II/III family protein [Alcaligenes faecalis]QCP81357.1 hypothetical protein D0C27_05385 [Alcaligenes faecalis]
MMVFDEEFVKNAKLKYRLVLGGGYEALKSNGFSPRAGVTPIQLSLPFPWRHPDRNVEFNLHSWRFINSFLGKFFSDFNEVYLKEAFEYIKDWKRYRDSEGKKSQFVWYDMAVGLRSIILGLFFDLHNQKIVSLSADDFSLLKSLVDDHLKNLSDRGNITGGNHALYQVIGLRILSISAGQGPQLEGYCTSILEGLLRLSFDDYSVNTENSPFYHGYNLDLLSRMRCGVFPSLDEKINKILREGSAISGWLTGVDGNYYSVGDSEGVGKEIKSAGPFDEVAAKIKHVHKDLSRSGYVVVRTHPRAPTLGNFSLLFHATNKSYIHSHSDHLSFIFFRSGHEIITDPGKFTYEYGEWRDYFVSDKAHNVIGLSGRAFLPSDVKLGSAHLNPVKVGLDFYELSGSVRKSDDFMFSRKIVYKPDFGLFLEDFIDNQSGSCSEMRFHFGQGVSASFEDDFVSLKKDNVLLAKLRPGPGYKSISIRRGGGVGFGWASKVYNKKFKIDVLVIEYEAKVTSVKTDIFFVK